MKYGRCVEIYGNIDQLNYHNLPWRNCLYQKQTSKSTVNTEKAYNGILILYLCSENEGLCLDSLTCYVVGHTTAGHNFKVKSVLFILRWLTCKRNHMFTCWTFLCFVYFEQLLCTVVSSCVTVDLIRAFWQINSRQTNSLLKYSLCFILFTSSYH